MIDKAHGYGYRNIGFILDRGYFSKANLKYMEKNGYSFLIMVKGMKDFIREIVIENQGSFENSRENILIDMICMEQLSGTCYTKGMRKRNIHIYYSDGKAYGEKQEIKQKIRRLKNIWTDVLGKNV